MGAEIFKIDKEMTEKMKPQVANPPPKMGRILCSKYTFIDPLRRGVGNLRPLVYLDNKSQTVSNYKVQ